MCETCDKLREFMENPAVQLIPNYDRLTPRQKQITAMKMRGQTIKQIATELGISDRTVRNTSWQAATAINIYTTEIYPKVMERIEEILNEPV